MKVKNKNEAANATTVASTTTSADEQVLVQKGAVPLGVKSVMRGSGIDDIEFVNELAEISDDEGVVVED